MKNNVFLRTDRCTRKLTASNDFSAKHNKLLNEESFLYLKHLCWYTAKVNYVLKVNTCPKCSKYREYTPPTYFCYLYQYRGIVHSFLPTTGQCVYLEQHNS